MSVFNVLFSGVISLQSFAGGEGWGGGESGELLVFCEGGRKRLGELFVQYEDFNIFLFFLAPCLSPVQASQPGFPEVQSFLNLIS